MAPTQRIMEADDGRQRSPVDEIVTQHDWELMQLLLAQAQEELEAAYARLADELSSRLGPGEGVHADDLSVLDVVESPPHRHLHVGLRNARVGTRHWPSLKVRLIEHHGRPGLALFALGAGDEPLAAWHATGTETGREFMLIVPGDAGGKSLLKRLGSSDWRTVCAAVELLVRHLRLSKDDRSVRWLIVARRLQAALVATPPQLRHDSAQIEAELGADGWLRVSLGNVDFGDRQLGDVQLRWHPAQERLHWLAPASDSAIPFAAWPVEADGSLRADLPLPLGRDAGSREWRRRWSALPAVERALMLAVLEALPGVADQWPADSAAPGSTPHFLRGAAARLHRSAYRDGLKGQLRETARRLVRRFAARTV